MSQRMTRSRKRQIDEENFEKFGIVVDEFGCLADDFGTNTLKAVKKNDDEDPWEENYVVEVKRQKRDESPESNPVYYRKVQTTAMVHRHDVQKSPTPESLPAPETTTDETSTTDEQNKIEMELLGNAETPVAAFEDEKPEKLLDAEDNDDTASDTTDKVAEDLKTLLEETKEDEITTNGLETHEIEVTQQEQVPEEPITKLEMRKPTVVDFDKIDLLSSEVILECVDA